MNLQPSSFGGDLRGLENFATVSPYNPELLFVQHTIGAQTITNTILIFFLGGGGGGCRVIV